MRVFIRPVGYSVVLALVSVGLVVMAAGIYNAAYSFGISRANPGPILVPPQSPVIEYDNVAYELVPSQLPLLPLVDNH